MALGDALRGPAHRARRWLSASVSDTADLVLGRCCLVCAQPGTELCCTCLDGLRAAPSLSVEIGSGTPAVVSGEYAGTVRDLVLAYKQDGHRGLAVGLGALLADAVVASVFLQGDRAIVVVPIPGHRRPLRGFDALAGIVRPAAEELARLGAPVTVVRALRSRASYPDAKDLTREQRRQHLSGAFRAGDSAALGRARSGSVVIVDDVITTGATVEEAIRALAAEGITVGAVAAIAATPPLSPDRSGRYREPARPTSHRSPHR